MLIPQLTLEQVQLFSILHRFPKFSLKFRQNEDLNVLKDLLNNTFTVPHPSLLLQFSETNLNADLLVSYLDSGVECLILEKPDVALLKELYLKGVTGDRILIQVNAQEFINFTAEHRNEFGFGYLVNADSEFKKLIDFLKEFKVVDNRQVVITDQKYLLSAEHFAFLDQQGLDYLVSYDQNIKVPTNIITLQPKTETEKFTYWLVWHLSLVLNTDRPDGLFSTVVSNLQSQTLGLAYSNLESLYHALLTGEGAYYSRKRKELWIKGKNSGSLQTLMRLQLDCDRDAIQFLVNQTQSGFCHLERDSCFGKLNGFSLLQKTLKERLEHSPPGSYTQKLFKDEKFLNAKIIEEAHELTEAKDKKEIEWEMSDLLYFGIVKCVQQDVSVTELEKVLDIRSQKVTRRPGLAKSISHLEEKRNPVVTPPLSRPNLPLQIRMKQQKPNEPILRPVMQTEQIFERIVPIVKSVKEKGDEALKEWTLKFDKVQLEQCFIKPPFHWQTHLTEEVRAAIDLAYDNIYKFHLAQKQFLQHSKPENNDIATIRVETVPGVECALHWRPLERIGVYVPGGSAVLPSTALMLLIPAKIAGCKQLILATPPRPDDSICPEVLYICDKVGIDGICIAGGAQAVAAMAYGTQTVPKVDKIVGPGNQYVTAAKMYCQNDFEALVSIDMPAGPSEVMVVADKSANLQHVVSDLLSQAEHGPDSQAVLVLLGAFQYDQVIEELKKQIQHLPRAEIILKSIQHSVLVQCLNEEEALMVVNQYASEHLILHLENAQEFSKRVLHAGSIFIGGFTPESCGDYASGTNHTLPTYGYARIYSGVNCFTFMKQMTSQKITKEGLKKLGPAVMALARVEGLEAHAKAIELRLQ